jgi:HEAT repeat protein
MNSKQTAIALMLTTALTAGSVEAQPTGAPPTSQPPATTMPSSKMPPTGTPPEKAAPAKLAGFALMDMEAVTLAQEMALMAGARASLAGEHAELASKLALAGSFDAFYGPGFHDHQSAEERERARERAARDKERNAYEEAYEHAREGRYDRAVQRFNDVLALKGDKIDAALYWKAYSQDRLGQRAEALATLATLTREHGKSSYLSQARALEAEVRRNSGQPARPQDQADEDLKLMAIAALQNQAPEQAVPMLQKLLAGTASPRVKERALFVLAQSDSAQARDVLKDVAKNGTPEMQSKAISYLGTHGGRESRAVLAEVYASSTDVDMKKRILRAFMVSGDKDRVLAAATTEQNAELRASAVQQLGVMGAHTELWTLYQKESAADVKKQIIRAMFVGGNQTRMIELARAEKNPDLRREAIRNLGLMGGKGTADALVEIYGSDKDPNVRKAVIQALALQDNADALVAIARKEEDPAIKREIISRLSTMSKSKAAMDYLMEIINK